MEKQDMPPPYQQQQLQTADAEKSPLNPPPPAYAQQQQQYPHQPYQQQPYQQQPYQQQPYPQQPYQQQPYVQQPQGYAPPTVVMAAPAQYYSEVPNNHSALAWLTCLFCCWPLGLIAIIKSNEVNSAAAQGDLIRARNASESARKFGYASLGIGIFMNIFAIIFMVIYFVAILPSITNQYS